MLRTQFRKLTPEEMTKFKTLSKRVPNRGLGMTRSELRALPKPKLRKMQAFQRKRYDKHHKVLLAYRDKLMKRIANRSVAQGVKVRQGKVGVYSSRYRRINGNPVYRGPKKGVFRKSNRQKRYIPQQLRKKIRYDRS